MYVCVCMYVYVYWNNTNTNNSRQPWYVIPIKINQRLPISWSRVPVCVHPTRPGDLRAGARGAGGGGGGVPRRREIEHEPFIGLLVYRLIHFVATVDVPVFIRLLSTECDTAIVLVLIIRTILFLSSLR